MRRFAVLCLAGLVAGCATTSPPAPIATSRSVAGAPDEVRARLSAAAAGLGLATQPGADTELRLVRAGAPAEWADCATQLVRHQDDDRGARVDFAAPLARSASVAIGLAGTAGGTTVSIAPQFTASYRNIYNNLAFERSCASTGYLERSLLNAAG
jgi:hypothetical protein